MPDVLVHKNSLRLGWKILFINTLLMALVAVALGYVFSLIYPPSVQIIFAPDGTAQIADQAESELAFFSTWVFFGIVLGLYLIIINPILLYVGSKAASPIKTTVRMILTSLIFSVFAGWCLVQLEDWGYAKEGATLLQMSEKVERLIALIVVGIVGALVCLPLTLWYRNRKDKEPAL